MNLVRGLRAFVRIFFAEMQRKGSAEHTRQEINWEKETAGDLTETKTEKEGIFAKFDKLVDEFVDLGKKLFWLVVVGGVLWWIAYSFVYAPSTREDDPALLTGSSKQLGSVVVALAGSFPAAHPRLQLLKAQNLDIYLSENEFYSVPYPDRSEAVAKVGRTWCKQVEHTYLPALRFRDIATGSTLASYSCVGMDARDRPRR